MKESPVREGIVCLYQPGFCLARVGMRTFKKAPKSHISLFVL